MRLLIHGLNFAPELVGVGKYTGEMAEWLAARGHDVRVVTAPPFNPKWKVAGGFSPWRYSREERFCRRQQPAEVPQLVAAAAPSGGRRSFEPDWYEPGLPEPDFGASDLLASAFAGPSRRSDQPLDLSCAAAGGRLTVFRCPLWVPREPSTGKRIVHLASFALASFPVMLRQTARPPEVVLVVEPTLFSLPAAWLTGRLCGAKTWLHVQDFEADAGFELGLMKSAGIRLAVGWVEGKLMSGFGRVSTISRKMQARLAQKGVALPACLLFPNWVDTHAIFPLFRPSRLRKELGIPASHTVALYAGTMARKQGLDVLGEAARRLAGRADLRFVFCGEGPGQRLLRNSTHQMASVQWLPLQPAERLNELLNLADIHLLPQRADAADLVMPSKLAGMLASGRPVVATARAATELARVIGGQGTGSRGIVVEPGEAGSFAAAIEELADHPDLRAILGRNARAYARAELEKRIVLANFESDLLAFADAA